MEEGRPEFDKTKPSTRQQDKKHWAMNFRFPIPVWGNPGSVEGPMGFDGEIVFFFGSLGKKASFGHTQKIHGEKTTCGE